MRNFEEEYKNYINEEIPDLWSRIEPQLQDKIVDDNKTDFDDKRHGNDVENTIDTASDYQKNLINAMAEGQEKNINVMTNQQKRTKKNQIYIFAKRALPAVAAILVLVIGIGVLQTSRYAKNESEAAVATDCAPEEATDEEFFAEAAEEAPDESFAETEISEEACEAAPEDEFYEETAEAESEEPVYEEATGMQNSMDVVKENESASKSDTGFSIPSQDVVAVKGAVLNGIEVADAAMKEKGYVYIYRFTLADGNKIRVYLTEEQCRNIEEAEIVVERKLKYDLDIIPCSDQDKEDELADCILQDIQSAND